MLFRFGASLVVSCLDIDADRHVVWITDTSSRVWFTSDVDSDNPQGSGQWFEVRVIISTLLLPFVQETYICTCCGLNIVACINR